HHEAALPLQPHRDAPKRVAKLRSPPAPRVGHGCIPPRARLACPPATTKGSGTSHAIAAVVAEIAVAVPDGNRAAVVARRSVALEACKLVALQMPRAARIHDCAGAFEQSRIEPAGSVSGMPVALRLLGGGAEPG